MRQFLRRVRWWRKDAPRQFWLVVGLLILTSGTVVAQTFPVKRQLVYEPCQANYGETVGGWDGDGDQVWNERNFHYEVRRFRIEAAAPIGWFHNVQEQPPSRLSTVDCQPELQGFVDTNHDSYQWFGARTSAIRLGMPDLGELNQGGRIKIDQPRTKPDDAVSPPIFGDSHGRAAAWVDDGAQANLVTTDKGQQLLWCQGNNQPLNPDQSCNDVADIGGKSVRGVGYLFVEDNCPKAGGVNCDQATAWYRRQNLDYSQLIGSNQRGELNPFYLQLDAVSTYANRVGAWMVLTFKYPKLSNISNQVSLDKQTYQVGETITATAGFSKIGPTVTNLSINPDLSNQPLQIIANFETSTGNLEDINKGKEAEAAAKFKITDAAQPGQCYNLTFNFQAESILEVDGSREVKLAPLASRYCIAAPASATYTYSVTTRGNVQSDVNEFADLAAETLASVSGWSQAGAGFSRVNSGGDFTLVLAAPDQMTSFSSGCDATYSCQAGGFVIINDERWRTATPSWNNNAGSLRDYRHMVINHETGHWLGFGHLNCSAPGAAAPVMQQQSISLQGCAHNPWPTPAEIQTLKSRL